jgi:DNA invertase Pin-like site-specific DNA recombinase
MTVYGYARVSTIGQTLAAQEATLHEAGAAKIFKEKISGAANHRAQLHRLLKTIDVGDAVLVTRLDRLARSTRDLLNILDKRESGRDIQVTWRHLGRHDHGPRPLDVDGSWRAC